MEKTTIFTVSILVIIVIVMLFTSKINFTDKVDIKNKLKLLPYWLKFIGIATALFSIIAHLTDIYGENKIIELFWQIGLTVGLLFIVLSKEKSEDEMIMQLRLNSAFFALIIGIIVHLLFILIDKLLGANDFQSYSSIYFINFTLIAYILFFYSLKRKLKK
ncbi:MAG: hypothetical protein KQH79_13490 [Bacteroidetes bacterium]|nr:hypothetical protein [Bacteroidota bacterium]